MTLESIVTADGPMPVRDPASETAREIATGTGFALILTALLWFTADPSAAVVWLGLSMAVYAARFLGARVPAGAVSQSAGRSPGWQASGLAVTGLAWGGLSVYLIASAGEPIAALVVVAAALGLAIAAAASDPGSRLAVWAFCLPALVPAAVAAVMVGSAAAPAYVALACLPMVTLPMVAGTMVSLLDEATTLRSRVESLEDAAARASDQISQLTLGVKTNSEKRAELEGHLREATSNLEVTRGKAEALGAALQRVSPYDAITGLLNAAKFDGVVAREWARMTRQEQPITLVTIALDQFDDYTSSHGTKGRDAAVRRVADVIKRAGSRPGDVAARMGENEFAILFPEADHKNGEVLADMLREQVKHLNLPNAGSAMHSVLTASFGVATVIPNSDISVADLKQRASDALYEAQFNGGDSVVRHRTMATVRLERWNHDAEGELTPDGMLRKLAVLGYQTHPHTYKVGESIADRRVQVDIIQAVLRGRLKVSLDGEARVLGPGDCLFIPKGLIRGAEVVGKGPVVCLEGSRA